MAKDSKTKAPWRATPLIRSTGLSRAAGCNIYVKLENLQPSGSFKARGIGNFILEALRKAQNAASTHFYSSSGGNAGLACVHAAVSLGCEATIIVPESTSAYMISKMRTAGAADVIQIGSSWFEADTYLRETVLPEAGKRGENAVYVPPFDHEDIWAGNSTMVDEILHDFERDAQLPSPDAIICSVGGGGMFCGIMQGLDRHHLAEQVQVLALETRGADSLSQALAKGQHITLPAITSIATTLGARQVAKKAFEYGHRDNVKSIVLSDAEAVKGCLQMADEERMLVEPSCGVCVAMCYDGRLKQHMPRLTAESTVVLVVCGGTGVTIGMLEKWEKQFA